MVTNALKYGYSELKYGWSEFTLRKLCIYYYYMMGWEWDGMGWDGDQSCVEIDADVNNGAVASGAALGGR
jgi:hypothetical protein